MNLNESDLKSHFHNLLYDLSHIITCVFISIFHSSFSQWKTSEAAIVMQASPGVLNEEIPRVA